MLVLTDRTKPMRTLFSQWRAPEEYDDKPLNEKIDIWSLGNNMYSLLTGCTLFSTSPSSDRFAHVCRFLTSLLCNAVSPFYDTAYSEVAKKVAANQTAFIDPRYKDRSFADAKLAEIIPMCWSYDPNDRIDIFRLVELLRTAVKKISVREA